MEDDWEVTYPEGIIQYNDLFRQKYLNYDGHVEMLDRLYKKHSVTRVLDLGCGIGTYLLKLTGKGYKCLGLDNSEESLDIAKRIAKEKGSDIDYRKGNMKSLRGIGLVDAIISMHVPISLKSLLRTVKNTHRLLSEGGLLSFMYLVKAKDIPNKDSRITLSVAEKDNVIVARLEPWELDGDFLTWDPVLIIQDGDICKIMVDHDKMELLSEEKENHLNVATTESGFEMVDNVYLYKSRSAPPWSIEVLKTIRKI